MPEGALAQGCGLLTDDAPARRRRTSRAGPSPLTGLLFVLPCMAMVAVFFLLPLGMLFWMSFYDWPLIGQRAWIGLGNYTAMLNDDGFWRSMLFTLKYTVATTVGIFIVAFPLALFVERPRPGVAFLRVVYFLPTVIGVSSASLIWVWLLNVNSGLLSPALQRLGLISRPIQVLAFADSAFWSIVVMMVWKTAGFTMILLLTGLQSIPSEIVEAARMDGAGPLQRFRLITLPLMRRPLALALILAVTGAALSFDQFYIITAGGPRNQTLTAVYSIFTNAFMSFRLGYGATLSLALMAILLGVSLVQLVLLRAKEGS